MRTATRQLYRRTDGLIEVHQSSMPVNYEDAKGQWKPIDNHPSAGQRPTNETSAKPAAIPSVCAITVRGRDCMPSDASTRTSDRPAARAMVQPQNSSAETLEKP